MKVSMATPIRNLDGTPGAISTGKPDDAPTPLTARRVLIDCLMYPHEDDARMSGVDKVRVVKLALKIDGEDEPDFTAEDIAFMVGRVDKMAPPLTVYRMREILDPASL